MDSSWTLHNLLKSHDNPFKVLWSPHGVPVESSWSLRGVLVESPWSPHGVHGVPIESPWSPHGVLMESMRTLPKESMESSSYVIVDYIHISNSGLGNQIW